VKSIVELNDALLQDEDGSTAKRLEMAGYIVVHVTAGPPLTVRVPAPPLRDQVAAEIFVRELPIFRNTRGYSNAAETAADYAVRMADVFMKELLK